MGPVCKLGPLAKSLMQSRLDARVAQDACGLLRVSRGFVGGGVGRRSVRAKGNNDKSVGSAFVRDKGGPCWIAVRADISVGQIRSIEHHVGRIAHRDTLL